MSFDKRLPSWMLYVISCARAIDLTADLLLNLVEAMEAIGRTDDE